MLNRVYVNNYKSLTNFECNLAPKQLIIGANGVGKTTLFEVLALLRDFCIRGDSPEGRLVGTTRTRWQDVPEQAFELDVSGNNGSYKLRLLIDSWGTPEKPRVVREEVIFSGQPIFRFEKGEVHLFNDQHEEKVKYPFDWHRSALATIAERRDNRKLWWFKNWLGGLLYVSPDPRAMKGVASQESPYPDQYLSNFADWYRHLRQEADDHAYLQSLSEVIDGFTSMRLQEAGERRREIKIRIASHTMKNGTKSEGEYLLGELSDGQRLLVGLYALLHFAIKAGGTICFDEPDNFIALREIQAWLSKALDRAEEADPESQILIASHHPELLNRMAYTAGIIFERPENLHTRCRRFDDSSETGLTAAELVARGWEHE